MMLRRGGPYLITLLSCLTICLVPVGCGKNSGPSAQDLKRRQRSRQTAELTKTKSVDQQIQVVQEHLDDGNLVAAQQTLRPLLISHPKHSGVVLISARCAAESGNPAAAAKLLDAIDPQDQQLHSQALWLAADWLIQAGQYDAAQERLERLTELPGEQTRAHRKLALILNNQGLRIQAAPHLRALARSGKIQEKELFAMHCYSEPFIDESMSKPDFKNQVTAAALAEAKMLRVEGEMKRARVLTAQLARAFPSSTSIFAFLGRIYLDHQDDEALQRWVEKLPDGIQREPDYWHTLGVWLQRKGKNNEAVRCLAETVARDPTDRLAYSALARSLQSLSQQDAAERVLERFELLSRTAAIFKSLGLRPGTRGELAELAEILNQLQRPFEAIAWRKISLKLHGGSESDLAALQQQREQLLAETGSSDLPPADFLVCGLELDQWPLPTIAVISASSDTKPKTAETTTAGPIILTNVSADVGLKFKYDNGDDRSDDKELLHQLTGGGIGVIDFDLDGWMDLYFSQGGGDAFNPAGSDPNQLLRNLDGLRFVDTTDHAQTGDRGYGQGVAAADINQDGFPDLLVANIGPNVLYINNGDGTFTRQVLPLSNPAGDWTTTIACGDLSGDHLPEIIDVNYVDDPDALKIYCTSESTSCVPIEFKPAVDYVWQLQPSGEILTWDGCQQSGERASYGFGAVISDFDGKPGNEMFIANDAKRNHYWVSAGTTEGPRRLMESARIFGCDAALMGDLPGCMGIAYGDIDRNGTLDLHVTNFWRQPAELYLQNPDGLFSNGNVGWGLFQHSRDTVGWGTHAVDFDRDGWLDLAVMNGHLHDYKSAIPYRMRPQLFRGEPGRFTSVIPNGPRDDYWTTPTLGRTLAVLDFNRDQKMDLVSNHLDVAAALLENQTGGGNCLQLELVGTTSERDAIGTTVTVTCGDQVWTSWVAGGDGFLCTNEAVVDFGLGSADKVDRVQVTWPTGQSQEFQGIAANTRVVIIEGDDAFFVRQTP